MSIVDPRGNPIASDDGHVSRLHELVDAAMGAISQQVALTTGGKPMGVAIVIGAELPGDRAHLTQAFGGHGGIIAGALAQTLMHLLEDEEEGSRGHALRAAMLPFTRRATREGGSDAQP